MLQESIISDVRKCRECGSYLALSWHATCKSPTDPVATEKKAQCQNCIYTKPDEWVGLSEVFKKDDLIKCWRTTPAEAVPKAGKRCYKWVSDEKRFDNHDGPNGVVSMSSIGTKETIWSEIFKGNKNATKYNITEEMLERAKELRTQETPLTMREVSKIINDEFSAEIGDNKPTHDNLTWHLTQRFPELKGIKAGVKNREYAPPTHKITDEILIRAKELRLTPLTMREVVKRINKEFSSESPIAEGVLSTTLLRKYPELKGLKVSRSGKRIKPANTEPEKVKELQTEEISSGVVEADPVEDTSVIPEVIPAIKEGARPPELEAATRLREGIKAVIEADELIENGGADEENTELGVFDYPDGFFDDALDLRKQGMHFWQICETLGEKYPTSLQVDGRLLWREFQKRHGEWASGAKWTDLLESKRREELQETPSLEKKVMLGLDDLDWDNIKKPQISRKRK
jgi:hypothetical protein